MCDWVSLDKAIRTKMQRAAGQIPSVRRNSTSPQKVAASRAAFFVIDNRWFVYWIAMTMLHFEMVFLECHNPSTNLGLISGICFQPSKSLIVNPQDELSGAEITVILQNEIIS